MFDWLFHLPLALAGALIVGALCLYAMAGLWWVRSRILPRMRTGIEDAEFVGTMVQAIMVFYGLAVALIAVSVWETHSEVSDMVSHEASRLASLYRDVENYPEPIRSQLQDELRGYAQYLIHEAWPLHQRGGHPTRGIEWMTRFQTTLMSFEPNSDGQRILHAEAFRAYNLMIEARRLRLEAMLTRLPGLLWGLVILGGAISLSAAFFFKVQDARLHGLLVTMLAAFMGLVFLMILAFDRPFHGDLGISSEPYELIYNEVMTP